MSQERSGTIPASAMLQEKGREYDAWYGCSVMPSVCMLMGCLKQLRVLNLFRLSGIGLELACNLTVLLFLVYTLHGSSHDLACFLLHGPVAC